MSNNETSIFCDSSAVTELNTQQIPPPEGSLKSLARKSTDFTLAANGICREIDPMKMVYTHLQLQSMFDSLSALYAKAFAIQWYHFKHTADVAVPTGTKTVDAPLLLARLYISHWMLDLYSSVRDAVVKLTPASVTKHFKTKLPRYSSVYDAVLCHLNSVIRPMYLKGFHESVVFIPTFADKMDKTNEKNLFGIEGFVFNFPAFLSLITAIKDKRAGWNTALITNDTVGRPVWLFDWHGNDCACSWFPEKGNYTSEDVMFAYLIGVACTPNLAHQDMDEWQQLPSSMDPGKVNHDLLVRQRPRCYFGGYEVESANVCNVSFNVSPDQGTGIGGHKRPRREGDEGRPSVTKEIIMVRRTTYVYFARVILKLSEEERLTALLSILLSR